MSASAKPASKNAQAVLTAMISDYRQLLNKKTFVEVRRGLK
jgi:hypothetical protein